MHRELHIANAFHEIKLSDKYVHHIHKEINSDHIPYEVMWRTTYYNREHTKSFDIFHERSYMEYIIRMVSILPSPTSQKHIWMSSKAKYDALSSKHVHNSNGVG